jgi:hypothetical protein
MSAIGVAISPTAVFSGSVDGDWRVSLVNPQAIVHVVGRAVFAAFLKCFVATDRVMTLEQMLQLNSLHVAKDSPAQNRNLQVLAFLMAGTLYELGDALQELCDAKVYEKLSDKSSWTPVNEARARWHKNKLMSKFRNQLGHHLGDPDVYTKGLDAMLQGNADLLLARGRGRARHSDEYPGAWDALFQGTDIDEAAFQQGLLLTKTTHLELPDQLLAVFAEVLDSCGIPVLDQRSKP